uniref:Uncharacterized protein n=1 Tax=Arundo donax TaxID=35708 RepID=A0A0A9GZL5_ARUDO
MPAVLRGRLPLFFFGGRRVAAATERPNRAGAEVRGGSPPCNGRSSSRDQRFEG